MKSTPFSRTFLLAAALCLAAVPRPASAGHPFGTEDAGTQGRGNVEVEFNGDRVHGSDGSRVLTLGNSITMGVHPRADLALSYSYDFVRAPDGTRDRATGPFQATLKGIVTEGDGKVPALGLKGGISLPAEEGGQASLLATAIAEWTTGPLTVFANAAAEIGTRLAGNDDDYSVIGASLAGAWRHSARWSLLSEILWEKQFSPSGPSLSEWLIGVKAQIRDNVAADAGIRWGLTHDSPHVTYLVGFTVGFRGTPAATRESPAAGRP